MGKKAFGPRSKKVKVKIKSERILKRRHKYIVKDPAKWRGKRQESLQVSGKPAERKVLKGLQKYIRFGL
ncbi:MAG: hypothetical protein K5776_10445 [Lachnospiraceae bacterium]|nr:hypothetical protein [Lachnospiraceae bacterium]